MALIISCEPTPRSPMCFSVYLEGKHKLAVKMGVKEAIVGGNEVRKKIHFFKSWKNCAPS